MPSHDEIYEKVKATLIDALGVDDDEITPNARLKADLGAESIDFLDIVFRLEKNFGIKIPRSELFPESLFAPDSGFAENGKVTEKGIAELRAKFATCRRRSHRQIGSEPQDRKCRRLVHGQYGRELPRFEVGIIVDRPFRRLIAPDRGQLTAREFCIDCQRLDF